MNSRVLIVEDNMALRNSLGALLPVWDFLPTLCADGEEFLRIAAEDPQAYAAVIIDVSLPDMSGWQALEQLRALKAECPALVCSGSPQPDELPEGCHFMMKPFHPDDMIELLQMLIEDVND